jgi:hypothetical protein
VLAVVIPCSCQKASGSLARPNKESLLLHTHSAATSSMWLFLDNALVRNQLLLVVCGYSLTMLFLGPSLRQSYQWAASAGGGVIPCMQSSVALWLPGGQLPIGSCLLQVVTHGCCHSKRHYFHSTQRGGWQAKAVRRVCCRCCLLSGRACLEYYLLSQPLERTFEV